MRLSFLKKSFNFYLLVILTILFCSCISYENISFDLYFNSKYLNYSNFFKSLDYSVFPEYPRTFPLWGYGLFHLLGSNKILFLIIQQTITFFTLLFFDKEILKNNLINKIEYFRFLIVISFPWILFHTQMWPKSITSNLLILGIIILIKYLKTNKFKYIVISSILFGVLSNFRSDYNYLYILFFLIIIFNQKSGLKNYLKSAVFPALIIILLIPWMLFTYKQIKTPILTSTNSGHVFFIGLGQLPDNYWEITPRDDDKVMDSILKNKFKIDYKSYNYQESKFLKEKFKDLVVGNPKEWIKKCFYAFKLVLLDPFYVGNIGNFQHNKFPNIYEIRELENLVYDFEFKQGINLIKKTNWEFSKKEAFQFIFTFFVKFQGIVLIFSFFLSLILSFKKFGLKLLKEPFNLIILLTIAYQISISVFAFHMPVYNNSIYLFYLLLTYLFFQKYLSIKQ